MKKRIGTNGLCSKKEVRIWWSLPLFAGLAIFTPVDRAWSQKAIIIDNVNSSNKSAVFFQKEKPIIKLRSLEEASDPLGGESGLSNNGSNDEAKLVNIVIPASPAVAVQRRDLSIPFSASALNSVGPVASKGLLFSNDKGQNWHEFGPMRPASDGNDFVFNAPADGEYWFALRLILQDGTETASRAQKFKIETGTPPATAPQTVDAGLPVSNVNVAGETADSPPQNEKVVQGLLSLTKKNNSSSSVHPTVGAHSNSTAGMTSSPSGVDPLTSRLNEMANEAPHPTGAPSDKPVAAIPFPGKIDRVERGKTRTGAPGISIRWFQPIQISGEKGKGKIRIERAPSPEGPWTPVADDAVDLDVNSPGYWFAAKEGDSEPFYLRTVSVVDADGTDTEWVDTLPSPLKFAPDTTPKKSTETNFANVSAELPAKTEEIPKKSDGPIKAWDDSLSNSSETKKIADASDKKDNNSVVDKTASINQSAPDIRRSTTGNNKGSFQHPRLTDPTRLSVNPIFNFGLGAITGKDRQGNRLPDYSDSVTPPPSDDEEPNIPPPPSRSIFMSQAEYRQIQMEYEQTVAQAKERARIIKQQKAQAEAFKSMGGLGGTQATVTDAQGNQINVTEGTVLYQDEKGNISSTPFNGGMNQATITDANGNIIGTMPGQGFQDMNMVFPDQANFSDFSNVSQSMPIDSTPQSTPPNSQNDFNYLNQNNSLEPYTSREQTLGGNSFDMDSNSQSALPSTLPPKPNSQE